jgi:hypothetical protein
MTLTNWLNGGETEGIVGLLFYSYIPSTIKENPK